MTFSQLTKMTFSTLLAIVMIVSSTTLTVAQQDALPIKIDLFDADIFILGQPEIVMNKGWANRSPSRFSCIWPNAPILLRISISRKLQGPF